MSGISLDAVFMKIGLILPVEYGGGTFRLFLNLIRYFASYSQIEVVVGIPDSYLNSVKVELGQVRREFPSIEIRGFNWRILTAGEVEDILPLHGVVVQRFISKSYQVPTDDHENFLNCNFWFIVSDRIAHPLVPLRPYGILVTDHLQRYVPEIFDCKTFQDMDSGAWNFIRAVRNADLAVVTSQGTAADVEMYSGCLNKILQIPTTLDTEHFLDIARQHERCCQAITARPYCVWVTNTSKHKNHLRMLEAIRRYFEVYNGILDIVVTGEDTKLFDPQEKLTKNDPRRPLWRNPYARKVRGSVNSILGQWAARIHWAGGVNDSEYVAIVRNSQFLVHNVLADNGTFSVIEAAILGRPAMSSDYPQMRELNKQFELDLHFFDAFDIDGTARMMSGLEGAQTYRGSRQLEQIEKFSWRSWDERVVTVIDSIVSMPRKEIACL